MVAPAQRPLVRGPTFIRLLARLTDAGVAATPHSLPDQLSQWIDWTRAVALSRALAGRLAATDTGAPVFDSAEAAAYARIRAGLQERIVRDSALAGVAKPAAAPSAGDGVRAEPDYAAFRQHYLAMQRAMQMATGKLRGHLRDMLAASSPEMARLAEVDALMELVLSPRESTLLAAVPGLLGQHFERLRKQGHEARDEAPATDAAPVAPSDAWLELFRKDMQGVLLAELDVRFLPLEGLLAALRTHPQGNHVQKTA